MAYYEDLEDRSLMLLTPKAAERIGHFHPGAYTTPYVGSLRTALEAALYELKMRDMMPSDITSLYGDSDGDFGGEAHHEDCIAARERLETALEPFRKEAGNE